MSRMTKEKTAGTEDQHELVGINSTVPLKVEHSEDLTDTAGGTTAPARERSAADTLPPLKVQTPRSSGWTKEAGVQYLVALDVDGTLVDHDGHMSPTVRETAAAVLEAGHHLVISTGRSKGATLPVIELIGQMRGYAVCSNGGMTLEIDPDLPEYHRVLDCVSFDPGQALVALEDRLPTAKFALETEDGGFYSTERFQDASFGIEAIGVDLHELAEMKAVRMVVYSTEHTPEEFASAIDEAGLHGVTYSVGWSAWLDIAANGVTKASALEQIRRKLGVDPSHTIAVGDGRNDIEMLDWAARGVAMGQAPDEVAAVCHEVTRTVYEDGVAEVLRSLL
jgi:Cof subfamily protein (haloacid dehalogenase superfamily)